MRTSRPTNPTNNHYPAHQSSSLNELLEHAAEALAQKYKSTSVKVPLLTL